MDILISHMTAFELLRYAHYARFSSSENEASLTCTPDRAPSENELDTLYRRVPELRELGRAPEMLVASTSQSRNSASCRCHVWSRALPSGSFFWLADGVRCTSAELTALLVAPSLSRLELTVLLSELMGLYAVAPSASRGMVQRAKPLTTPEKMQRFLNSVPGARGVALVRSVLADVCAGSGSPRETKLSLRLGLPPSRKGYGLPVLSMNEPVVVDRLGSLFGEKGIRKPDILIGRADGLAHAALAFEYDGPDHETPEGVREDTRRTNELRAMGIGEYRINAELYRDIDYMDDVVDRARREAGLPRLHLTAKQKTLRRRRHFELYRELEGIDGVHWSYPGC